MKRLLIFTIVLQSCAKNKETPPFNQAGFSRVILTNVMVDSLTKNVFGNYFIILEAIPLKKYLCTTTFYITDVTSTQIPMICNFAEVAINLGLTGQNGYINSELLTFNSADYPLPGPLCADNLWLPSGHQYHITAVSSCSTSLDKPSTLFWTTSITSGLEALIWKI